MLSHPTRPPDRYAPLIQRGPGQVAELSRERDPATVRILSICRLRREVGLVSCDLGAPEPAWLATASRDHEAAPRGVQQRHNEVIGDPI